MYKAIELTIELKGDAKLRSDQAQIPVRFKQALHSLTNASNPYADKAGKAPHAIDCCICLADIGPYQALFISPCSHSFHYKCIKQILTTMFPCPVCRQVTNLEASVSMESLPIDGMDLN